MLIQLVKHLRGGMQIFVKTLPTRHLSSLPAYVALHASLAWTRVKARRNDEDGADLVAIPNKANGTPKERI